MGKKSRKKKRGGAATASSEGGLPKVDLSAIDNSVCAICKKEIDIFHWDAESKTNLLDCCGHSICRGCYDRTHQEKWDEMEQFAHLVLDGNAPSRPSVIPELAKLSSPPCALCGTAKAESNVERRSRIKRLAEAGHTHAQYSLASMFKFGDTGLRQDDKAALMWLEKAARAGHVTACARMGRCYYAGECVAQDHEQAKLWYQRGGDNAIALQGLGTMYTLGEETQKDEAKAMDMFRRAAEHGYPWGLASYAGVLSIAGRLEEALIHYDKAARMEQYLGGTDGYVVPSCQFSYAGTLLRLRTPFLEGRDTNRANDPFPLALFWTRRAAMNGNEEARDYLKQVEPTVHANCRHCGKPDPKNTCTKCRAASYCDKTCQTKDWKAGHKVACNGLPQLFKSYPEDACALCGKEMPGYTCHGCKKANYCNAACQKKHWEEGKHQDECRFL